MGLTGLQRSTGRGTIMTLYYALHGASVAISLGCKGLAGDWARAVRTAMKAVVVVSAICTALLLIYGVPKRNGSL